MICKLKFDIHSYWRAGTGRAQGALLDDVVHKDSYGLPCLPGRTVKGLLRDAVYRAGEWGHVKKELVNTLFGENAVQNTNSDDKEPETRLETKKGALRVSDAVIEKEVSNYLISLIKSQEKTEYKKLCNGFFQSIQATAINHETSSAEEHSLRALEVTIPLVLTAEIDGLTPEWQEEIKKCLPLIRAVGTSRTRGLGRVTVTLEKEKA